jgi:hypothetical protein
MSSAPPLAPATDDQQTVYLVLDNFGGRMDRSWRKTDEGKTDLKALIVDLLDGQYNDPVRVVAFNLVGGWVRDASQEIADLIRHCCARMASMFRPSSGTSSRNMAAGARFDSCHHYRTFSSEDSRLGLDGLVSKRRDWVKVKIGPSRV